MQCAASACLQHEGNADYSRVARDGKRCWPKDRSRKVRQSVGLRYVLLQFQNNTVSVVCSLDREKAALAQIKAKHN